MKPDFQIENLPNELLIMIGMYLDPVSLSRWTRVGHQFSRVRHYVQASAEYFQSVLKYRNPGFLWQFLFAAEGKYSWQAFKRYFTEVFQEPEIDAQSISVFFSNIRPQLMKERSWDTPSIKERRQAFFKKWSDYVILKHKMHQALIKAQQIKPYLCPSSSNSLSSDRLIRIEQQRIALLRTLVTGHLNGHEVALTADDPIRLYFELEHFLTFAVLCIKLNKARRQGLNSPVRANIDWVRRMDRETFFVLSTSEPYARLECIIQDRSWDPVWKMLTNNDIEEHFKVHSHMSYYNIPAGVIAKAIYYNLLDSNRFSIGKLHKMARGAGSTEFLLSHSQTLRRLTTHPEILELIIKNGLDLSHRSHQNLLSNPIFIEYLADNKFMIKALMAHSQSPYMIQFLRNPKIRGLLNRKDIKNLKHHKSSLFNIAFQRELNQIKQELNVRRALRHWHTKISQIQNLDHLLMKPSFFKLTAHSKRNQHKKKGRDISKLKKPITLSDDLYESWDDPEAEFHALVKKITAMNSPAPPPPKKFDWTKLARVFKRGIASIGALWGSLTLLSGFGTCVLGWSVAEKSLTILTATVLTGLSAPTAGALGIAIGATVLALAIAALVHHYFKAHPNPQAKHQSHSNSKPTQNRYRQFQPSRQRLAHYHGSHPVELRP